jgi:hypothetical protein
VLIALCSVRKQTETDIDTDLFWQNPMDVRLALSYKPMPLGIQVFNSGKVC